MHGESNKKWGKGLQGAGEFIRVVNASKVYQTQDGGEVEAFTNFNLEIEEDEFLVLVGPSGCGKSTLLKMIVGLLPHTRGAVYFQGTEVLSPRTVQSDRHILYGMGNSGFCPGCSCMSTAARSAAVPA